MEKMISIIVPVYNVRKWLPQCVASILQQTYQNFELLLIDDGSDDGSAEMCKNYSLQDDRIQFLTQNHGGAAKARNLALDCARGEYIGFVDGDDYIEAKMYEELVKALEENQVDIACTGMIRETEEGTHQRILHSVSQPHLYSGIEVVREIFHNGAVETSLCLKLFRRECWDTVRLPDGETNEDAKIIFDLYLKHTLIHIGCGYYHYRNRLDSITHRQNFKQVEQIWHNAQMFVQLANKEYPAILPDTIYYQTWIARCLLLGGKLDKTSAAYRECTLHYQQHKDLLGFDFPMLLAKLHLYSFCKRLLGRN